MAASFIVVKLYNHKGQLVSFDVVTELSNRCCIRAYDKNGENQQFDSTEAYHADEWASGHGFRVEFENRTLDFSLEEE
jgi:hypothetical protein